ncbi:MAG TPA: carboxypeptidase-like regulatory domain-containing protein [Pyrinomonadaceae bacterium]|nr:carboxypeptidase-like regulatory domain-containing protein [Pyrinomonadaceae bacterium]
MFTLRAMRITFALVLSSLCISAQAQQPAVKTESASTGAITGKVIDESGQPLANATVYARPASNTPSGYHPVLTNREGAFEINGLNQGNYNVTATMSGYTTPMREPGARTPPTHRVGDSVTITLMKGGVVTGTVTNANGEPVVLVNVRAQMIRDPSGRRVTNGPNRERTTDDRGVYRIYGLYPGTYVLLAGGQTQSTHLFGNPFESDVPTYASSATRDTAQEITVRNGEELTGVDIRYRGEQGRVISGEVKRAAGPNTGINLQLTIAGDAGVPWSDSSYQQPGERSFAFYGIADGDYRLYAQTHSPTGEILLSEAKQIRVKGADISGVELTMRPLASMAGRVVLQEMNAPECKEKPRPSFDDTFIGAWHRVTEKAKETPQALWSLGAPVRPDAEGNFVVKNLVAGEYHLVPRFSARYWYVHSISLTPPATAGAKTAGKPVDATRVWTNVKPGDKLSGLTITLAQGAGLLRGRIVLGEGEQVPEKLFVYLAPVEREKAEDVWRYYAVLVSPEGQIVLNHIAPGRYWIVARTAEDDEAAPPTKLRWPHETEMRARIRREAEAAKTEIEFKPCQNISGFQLPLKPQDQ